MSKRHLRTDPVCQNCGEHVEKRFCGTCGQENIETRQSFGHLFRHFIEDLTHYDGNFWRTLRFLIFRPAYLTKQFLQGKRSSFVPPVRLYIFISFITFFLPYLLPKAEDGQEEFRIAEEAKKDTSDLHAKYLSYELMAETVIIPRIYTSVQQMDSIENTLPESERRNFMSHWFNKRFIEMRKYNKFELGERFFDSFGRNMPKALFIYLPLFAFILWLFHNKKRWLYFDHAIFTLHYFSFLLLIINFLAIAESLVFLSKDAYLMVFGSAFFLVFIGIILYFFVAHRRLYEEKWGFLGFIRAIFIYGINLLVFGGVLIGLAFVSLFSIH